MIGHAKGQLVERRPFSLRINAAQKYWVMVVMDVFTRRIIGFGVAPADLDGPAVCRMFNRAIARQRAPTISFFR
jgi:putative transposase